MAFAKKIELAREEVKLEVERAKHMEFKELNDEIERRKIENEREKVEKENLRNELTDTQTKLLATARKYGEDKKRDKDQIAHDRFLVNDMTALLENTITFLMMLLSK